MAGNPEGVHGSALPVVRRTVARDLNSAAIHLLRGLRSTDRLAGLTSARLSALSVLVFAGPTPLGRLAAIEGVASPTMTRIVDGLVTLGLAARGEHPDTSRVVLVSATPAGRDLMLTAAERRFDAIGGALARLPAKDQAVIAAAAPALRRLAEQLRAAAPSS